MRRPFLTWLTSPRERFLRRFVLSSKDEPLVDEVDLIDSNPTYVRVVRYEGRRESTVSFEDQAPCRSFAIEIEAATPRDENTPNIFNESKQSLETLLHSDEQMLDELT